MSNTFNNGKSIPIIVLPPTSFEIPNFREVWEYRGLLLFLVRRDLKLRFQQTFIGVLWILFQPLILMLIFSAVFGILIRIPSDGIPYTLFFLSAFIVWQFFTQVVNNSAFSLVGNINVILKSYFPRLILPLSAMVGALIDFCISFLLFMIFIFFSGEYSINIRYLFLPALLLFTTIFSSGVGLLFGSFMVIFRDMKNLVSFILMIWMYVTPIIYPISIVPEEFHILFYLNPMTSVINAFRWIFFDYGTFPDPIYLFVSFIVACLIWFFGAISFRSMENKIADVM